MESRLTTTPFIRPPRYYGHILSNQKYKTLTQFYYFEDPVNATTSLLRPGFYGPTVVVLTGFHYTQILPSVIAVWNRKQQAECSTTISPGAVTARKNTRSWRFSSWKGELCKSQRHHHNLIKKRNAESTRSSSTGGIITETSHQCWGGSF